MSCLRHKAVPPMRLEPATALSEVMHSTTEPPRSSSKSLALLSLFYCLLLLVFLWGLVFGQLFVMQYLGSLLVSSSEI